MIIKKRSSLIHPRLISSNNLVDNAVIAIKKRTLAKLVCV